MHKKDYTYFNFILIDFYIKGLFITRLNLFETEWV